MNPPLTTVHLAAEEIGESAVELLLEQVAGRELRSEAALSTSVRWRVRDSGAQSGVLNFY